MKNGQGKCKMCNYATGAASSSRCNTTNLIRHIIAMHGKTENGKNLQKAVGVKKAEKKKEEEKRKAQNKKNASLLSFVNRQVTMPRKEKKELDKVVIKHLVCSNSPFSEMEEHSFREMLFKFNPSYVAPSASTVGRLVDELKVEAKSALKEEVSSEVNKTSHRVVHITFDHGTSSDRFHSKKLGISLHYLTSNWEMQSETLGEFKCEGSQTGAVIREKVKEALMEVGYDGSWLVCVTTDNAKNVASARAVGRHAQVGLNVVYDGGCVDHLLHLVIEEAMAPSDLKPMKDGLEKVSHLVKYMKESSLALEAFLQSQQDLGMNPISPIQGTSNRWYFKRESARVMLGLQPAVEHWWTTFDVPYYLEELSREEWAMLNAYVESTAPFLIASKMFGGEVYCTASSVIPCLDEIKTKLKDMETKFSEGPMKTYVKNLQKYMCSDVAPRRFKNDLYKSTAPYNILTALDPRFFHISFSLYSPQCTSTILGITTCTLMKSSTRTSRM